MFCETKMKPYFWFHVYETITKTYKYIIPDNSMERKTILLLVPSIFIIIVLAIGILNHFGISIYPISQEFCGCHQMIPSNYFLFFATIIILASIPITYYYTSNRMEKKLNEHIESLSRIINKNRDPKSKGDLSSEKKILKFLNPSEQKIIRILLKNEGEMLQSQISKIDNMTKLKVHRAVKSLEQKKIVEAEHHGKTKKISLTREIKKLLTP